MSNETGNSSGVSGPRARGRVFGVPKRCWCGELVVSLTLKSTANPYRRYFRCSFSAERKLSNDNHTYKWVDEALLDEVEALSLRTGRIEQTFLVDRVEEERKKFEELETEICGRMEDVVSETKWEVKKAMVVVVLGCLVMIVLTKLI